MKITREFQIFAKPIGALCNLHCDYCYYLSKKDLYSGNSHWMMSDALLDQYIQQLIEATTEPAILFSWHGGEPLLAGIDFFRKVVGLQKKYQPANKKIVNGIQTNGTLITDEWARFLSEEAFYVGISIDGPEELHNLYRKNPKGEGTFLQVLNGFKLLREYGVNPEVLCVVNSLNAKYPLEIYRFFKSLGTEFMTFLPLAEQQKGVPGSATTGSVEAKEFGLFLIRIFDEWVENDIGRIQIQIFEEAISTAFATEHVLCVFKENCGGVPVIEHNGDFYSCDHFTDRKHLLGNIKEHPIEYFLDSQEQKSFGMKKSLSLPKFCIGCNVKSMCNGECPKNRFIKTPDGEPGLNYLCAGYKMFFNHCKPFVEGLKEALHQQSQ